MIFGIKTKKDKLIEEIEELEEEIRKKDNAILELARHETGKLYVGPARSFDYIPVKSRHFLEDEIPLDFLKRDIAHKMAVFLEDQIHFEVIEVDGRKFLEGTLNVRREK